MRNKYGARKLTAPDGQVFDSLKEYQRWIDLKIMQRAGVISDLRRQVTYELIPKQKGERACNYIADFTRCSVVWNARTNIGAGLTLREQSSTISVSTTREWSVPSTDVVAADGIQM